MKNAFTVIIATLAYLIATDIYTPSMPAIGEYFAKDSNSVQKTLTYFLLGAVFSSLLAGYLADLYGKRRVMLIGMVIAVIGGLIAPVANSIDLLIFSRFLQGLGGAVGPAVGFSIIQDTFPEKKAIKIFGIMGMAFAIIPAFAPVLGGFINEFFGWQANFIVILALMVGSLICIWLLLPVDQPRPEDSKKQNLLQTYKTILTNRNFLVYALLVPLLYSGEWCALSFLPFYLQQKLGLSSDLYGVFIGATIVWYAVGSAIGSKIFH